MIRKTDAMVLKLAFVFMWLYYLMCIQGMQLLSKNQKIVGEPLPLSKAGERLIRDILKRTPGTIPKSENEQLNLNCKNEATEYLFGEFPDAEIRWKHNNKNFVLQPSRMTYKLNSLYIQSLKTKDSGVFSCEVNVSPSRHYVVALIVVVVGSTGIRVLPGDSFNMDCNSKQLGTLYPGAVRYWEHNGKLLKHTKLAAVSTLQSFSAADGRVGNWTCSVYDETLQKLWVTAKYSVTLAPVPPLMTHVRVFVKHNKVQSGLILMGAAFVLVTLMNLMMRLMERKERKRRQEIERLRKMLGIEPLEKDASLNTSVH